MGENNISLFSRLTFLLSLWNALSVSIDSYLIFIVWGRHEVHSTNTHCLRDADW